MRDGARALLLAFLAVESGCGESPATRATSSASTTNGGATQTASTVSSGPASPSSKGPVKNLTPNDFLSQGPPTIVVGTLGDDATDRAIAAQARLIAELLPGATIVPDTSFDASAGPSAWPANPVLYGGAHVNAVVAALGDALPLRVEAERLVVGGETYGGPGQRVITVVPAGVRHPAFLLYAGTGPSGVTEINGVRHGAEPLLIADVFGRLQTGMWERDQSGNVTAKLGIRARRIPWRSVEHSVVGVGVRVAFPEQLPAAADEAAVVDAVVRGLTLAMERLKVAAPPPTTVYVYPDSRSKESLTGDKGAGHAVASGAALHVLQVDPSEGGGLEHLVTHEATHVITGQLWGPAGSSLIGEGLAVWASGTYAGIPLAEWQRKLSDRPAALTLLPMKAFRSKPESETYPFGGLLVSVAIERVGFEKVRDHLFGATAQSWATACKAAGTTAEALDAAVAARR